MSHFIIYYYFIIYQVWGGIDTPVFWRIPLSGATTLEEIFTHCYKMIVAGTTGTTLDGQLVRSKNISDVSITFHNYKPDCLP